MANIKSVKKRIRQAEAKREFNRYYLKTFRTTLKKIRGLKEKTEGLAQFSGFVSYVDKIAAKGLIHKNKASNIKSKVWKRLQTLA